MVVTLLVFSLLLHFVTFYIIIVLIQRMNHLRSMTGEDALKDIDKILQSHLDAIRAENQALIEDIDKNKSKSHFPKPFRRPDTFDMDTPVKEKPIVKEKSEILDRKKAPQYTPPIEKVVDQVKQTDTAQVLHLYEKGLSSQDIAKKLNIGKGEVELMLNLSKRRPT